MKGYVSSSVRSVGETTDIDYKESWKNYPCESIKSAFPQPLTAGHEVVR